MAPSNAENAIGYCNKALQFYHRLDMHDLVLSCRCRSRYEPMAMIDLVCTTLVSKSCLYGPEGPTLQQGQFPNSQLLDLYFYVLTSFYTGLVTSHKQESFFFPRRPYTLCRRRLLREVFFCGTRSTLPGLYRS